MALSHANHVAARRAGPVDTLFPSKSDMRPDPQQLTPSHNLDLSGSCFGWGIETRAVKRRSVPEHSLDGVQELAHDGADGLELLEVSGLDEMPVVGLDVGVR